MTEFSGVGGRVSNDQFPQETVDQASLTQPSDDDTSADDLSTEPSTDDAGDGSAAAE